MHQTSALRKPDIGALRKAFLRHLPDRLASITEHWRLLAQGDWDPQKLIRLHRQTIDLTRSIDQFGLAHISESVLALQTCLNALVDHETHPGPQQIDEVYQLIRMIQSAVRQAVKSPNLGHGRTKSAGEVKIAILRQTPSFANNLVSVLESLQCSVSSFEQVEELTALFDTKVPDMVLIDTALLPMLSPFNNLLTARRLQHKTRVPLAFIANNADLSMRLRALRMGADAYFITPLDVNAVAAKVKQIAAPEKAHRYRVLIVEDDTSQADFAASILNKGGMETRCVTEPLKVLQALDEFRPDLILMDLYMPEANGMELTSIIREESEFVGIPIIFLSGEQEKEKQLDALSVGGDDFVSKPIRPRHLIGLINNRIRRTRDIQHNPDMISAREPITGLFTRRHFFERLEAIISKDKVALGGVMVIEFDHLASVRDEMDKSRIDALLAEAGTLIVDLLESREIASNIGDGVCGVIANRPDLQALRDLAEQFRQAIATHLFHPIKGSFTSTVSIGICPFSDSLDDVAGTLARATTACHKARADGGDRIEIHQFDIKQPDREEDGDWLLHLVQQALIQDGFQVLYQPLINLHQRNEENYEVILRLRTSEGDLIHPSEFIPEARRGNLLNDTDEWITEHALMLMDDYRNQGRALNLFIPQNPETLEDPERIKWLREQLRSRQLVGTGLTLEFKLVDLAGNLRAAKMFIDAMRDMGLSISLARFNANAAAFKVLHYLQIDYIRVANQVLEMDPETVRTVVDKAHAIGVRVIVPSVDDPKAIERNWSSGADFIQGNSIQRPETHLLYDFSEPMVQV